jgi:peptidyl-prolyl cis-trans isomerase SurA
LKCIARATLALGLALTFAASAARAASPSTPAATTPAAPPATSSPAAAANATPSDAQRLDGIAAVVNDDVILQSDVEEQLALFVQSNGLRPDSVAVDTLRRQILDQLIDEKLIVAEAKRQGVTVADAEVDRQVDQALKDTKARVGGDAAFQEQLTREGLTEAKLRDKYHNDLQRQMLAQRMREKQLPHRAVPATEAEAFFTAHPEKFPKVPAQLRLSVIQLPVTADSVTDNKAKAAVLAARKRILAGEKFAKVAQQVSEDTGTAQSGGDLGYFAQGTMEPAFEKVAFSLKLNTVSMPVRTPYGWHVLEVIDRDTVKTHSGRDSLDKTGAPLLEAHVRHLMVRVPLTQQDSDRTLALAQKIRDQLARGADFAALAKRYSKYDAADPSGDVGYVPANSLRENIRDGLDSLKIGDISEPLANQVGYNIFKLTDRKPERAYTLDEVRAELPQAVEQIEQRDRYDAWVKTLRAKAHLDIRKG